MKENFRKFAAKSESGQAIIIIVFAFIGLVAMVGLVTDTGLLLIEYGKLKRAVDAAAVAAAQEYRPDPATGDLNVTAVENAATSFLQLNQMQNVSNLVIHTCEDTGADRPDLCNPDPVGNPEENRKLVEVTASSNASFGFLRVLGITGVTLSASSIGEAATIDLVLIMDTSASMAFETLNEDRTATPPPGADTPSRPGPDDDPSVCNVADNCQPMRAVKDIALDFVDSLIFFGYDRVAIVTMTSQAPGELRDPMELMPLSFGRGQILNGINDIRVFQPRVCNDTDTEGACLKYVPGVGFTGTICEIYERNTGTASANPSSCPSSNIGGVMDLARQAFTGGQAGTTEIRSEALWVVVSLIGGPANSTNSNGYFSNGYCPTDTWFLWLNQGPWCRDKSTTSRHAASETRSYTNPFTGETSSISAYDADDFARDSADALAASKTGTGVTIYTIGLGSQINNVTKNADGSIAIPGDPPPAAALLEYIATEAGDTLNPDINHGQYFFAPTSTSLRNIFELIAQNIATKISQ